MPFKDPERKRAYQREWVRRNADRHRELSREAMRRWRERHPDEHNAESRAYYARDPARRQRQIDASPNRKAVRIASEHRRRSLLAASAQSFRYTDWLALLDRAQGRCEYCRSEAPLQVDHKIPLARGGTNSIENIAAACARCNQRKHKLTDEEFRARLAAEKQGHRRYT